MLIVLFRHGPTAGADSKRWPDDRLRPLSSDGRERTLIAAHGLERLLPESTVIATSPLKRTLETARLLADATGIEAIETLEALAPGGSSHKVLDSLAARGTDASIVLVGHDSGLGNLAGTLLGGPALALKKAGACAIDCSKKPGPAAGQLRWLLSPSILRRLGGKPARS